MYWAAGQVRQNNDGRNTEEGREDIRRTTISVTDKHIMHVYLSRSKV